MVTETSDAPRQAPAMVSDTQCASPNTLPVAVVTAAMTHRGNAALVTTVCTLLFLVWSEFTVNGGNKTQRRVPAAPYRTVACSVEQIGSLDYRLNLQECAVLQPK